VQSQAPPLNWTELSIHLIVEMLKRFATVHTLTPWAALSEHFWWFGRFRFRRPVSIALSALRQAEPKARSDFDASDTDGLRPAGVRNGFFPRNVVAPRDVVAGFSLRP